MLSVENKTNIIILLDRSGSMSAIANDVKGSIKSFIEKQKKESGECYISLIQFDSINPQEIVFKNEDIQKVKYDPDSFFPRSMTPLWDALGLALKSFNYNKDEKNVLVVITDGAENSSREFTAKQVRDLVSEREKEGWVFVYLGANVDSFKEGGAIGFAANTTASYEFSGKGIQKAMDMTSHKLSSYRTHCGPGGQSVMGYDDSDRSELLSK
jgi:Mg-chelatase subunit ChlD